jgi:hypothetical protein
MYIGNWIHMDISTGNVIALRAVAGTNAKRRLIDL